LLSHKSKSEFKFVYYILYNFISATWVGWTGNCCINGSL